MIHDSLLKPSRVGLMDTMEQGERGPLSFTSGEKPFEIFSDGEMSAASSQAGSSTSRNDAASQVSSISDEPYHGLLQLLQQGAPPPVEWTCVNCHSKFISSGGLLNHHVTSCIHRTISPTTVFSTTTMVELLKQVDPEHPVDGEPIWWVGLEDDDEDGRQEEDSQEQARMGDEEQLWMKQEEQENREYPAFPLDAPVWLSEAEMRRWRAASDRKLAQFILIPKN